MQVEWVGVMFIRLHMYLEQLFRIASEFNKKKEIFTFLD